MLCSKCFLEKTLINFSFRNREKNIRKRICNSCHSAYRKQHYMQNKSKYIEKAALWNAKQKEKLVKFLFHRLSQSSCVDCGENDIVVLDFDHIGNKKLGIAEMFRNRYSIAAIEDEIAKCVVRCANCHRRKTARERGTWKFKLLELIVD